MSWAVSFTGSHEDAKAAISAQLEACAKNYEGTQEANDVRAVQARVMDLIDNTGIGHDEATNTDWNGVSVSASGSQEKSAGGRLVAASFRVEVKQVALPKPSNG